MENSGINKVQAQRAYFLQQGKSIIHLNDLLNSNIFKHHIGKWFSILLEIIFYLVFLYILFVAIILPTDIQVYFPGYNTNVFGLSYSNEDITAFFIVMKLFIFFLGLPLLILARLLARNRKKNKLILEAYLITETMKQDFDKAVKELEL